jgi:hypothetical protein
LEKVHFIFEILPPQVDSMQGRNSDENRTRSDETSKPKEMMFSKCLVPM